MKITNKEFARLANKIYGFDMKRTEMHLGLIRAEWKAEKKLHLERCSIC